jgi:hypothetical protein
MCTAAAFTMPWNFSFLALENFLINTKFCKDDLGDCENKAQLLTQFVDYVLWENASKWRDSEPFLTSRELKNTWSAFFSARPQSAFSKKEQPKQQAQPKEKKFNRPTVGFKKLPFIDVCYNWNKGTCPKQAGACSCCVEYRCATFATTAQIPPTSRPSAGRTTGGWSPTPNSKSNIVVKAANEQCYNNA